MKYTLAALALVTAGEVNGAKLRGITFRRLDEGGTDDSFTGTLGLTGGAGPYVKVKNNNPKKWQKLTIGRWEEGEDPYDTPSTFAWTSRQDGLLRTTLDDDMCIQAGYGDKVERGTKLRLNNCDEDNEFQRWGVGLGGPMKLSNSKYGDLCVASRGTNFNLDEDPMIMVDCDIIEKGCGRGCFSFD
jgi:hypothetical protein